MANAVSAGWHGHDYQARFFWIHASALRDPDQSHVIEVSYEADGPKAFDDVIIRYDPPRASTGPVRISVDYHQIKFHVTGAGRFGYADLIDPAFIGAESVCSGLMIQDTHLGENVRHLEVSNDQTTSSIFS